MPTPPACPHKNRASRRALACTIAALGVFGAQASPPPAAIESSAAGSSPRIATLDLEGQFRSEASNFTTRLALPVFHQRTSATLLQVNADVGAQSLWGIGGGLVQRFRPHGGDWVLGLYGFYETRQAPH